MKCMTSSCKWIHGLNQLWTNLFSGVWTKVCASVSVRLSTINQPKTQKKITNQSIEIIHPVWLGVSPRAYHIPSFYNQRGEGEWKNCAVIGAVIDLSLWNENGRDVLFCLLLNFDRFELNFEDRTNFIEFGCFKSLVFCEFVKFTFNQNPCIGKFFSFLYFFLLLNFYNGIHFILAKLVYYIRVSKPSSRYFCEECHYCVTTSSIINASYCLLHLNVSLIKYYTYRTLASYTVNRNFN